MPARILRFLPASQWCTAASVKPFYLVAYATGKRPCLRSESDSEVLACLLEHYYRGNLEEAVKGAVNDLKGSYALIAMCSQEKGKLVCACQDSPLLSAWEGELYCLRTTGPADPQQRCISWRGEMAAVTTGKLPSIIPGGKISKAPVRIEYNASLAERRGLRPFHA